MNMVGIYIGGSMAQSNLNVISYFLQHVPDFVSDDVVFIDKFSINKAERHCSCDVIKYDGKKFLESVQDWERYDEYATQFLNCNKIDKLLVVKLPYSKGFMDGDDKTLRTFLSTTNKQAGMGFVSVRNQLESFAFIRAASKICDYVYQYVIDPNEVVLSNYFSFDHFEMLYYLDRSGCKFAPYWCYGLLNDDGVSNQKKIDDFMFYCTAEGDNRAWLREIADDVERNCSLDVNIIRKGSRKNATKKKPISQELYFFLLGSTRYTAVIPSYCLSTFSWMRFMEAVYCGCLPFVFDNCDLTEVRDTFPDVCDIIESSLLVSDFYDIEDRIGLTTERERIKLVSEIANCKSLERAMDLDEIKKQWQKVEGL